MLRMATLHPGLQARILREGIELGAVLVDVGNADGLLGDAHDAAVGSGVLAHLVEAEERLRVGERSSGIDGFSKSPAFVSETFCTFAAGNV